MKHKPKGNPKLKMARKMLMAKEISPTMNEGGVKTRNPDYANPFDSVAWNARKEARALKVKKAVAKAKNKK